MIEWRIGSRVGKILFATGIAGCVPLTRSFGGRHRILVSILCSATGIGAMMIAVFARESEFQGARTMPWAVSFVRGVFILVGGAAVIAALVIATASGRE